MKCKKCGCDLEVNDKFCYNCGEIVENNIEQTEIKEPIFPDAKEAPLPGTSSSNVKSDDTSTSIEESKVESAQEKIVVEDKKQTDEKDKKKKSNPLVLVIIVVLAITAAILLFILLYGTEGLKMASKTTTTTSTTTTTTTTTKKALLTNEHVIDSIKITVPSDWTYLDNTSDSGTIVSQTVGLQINISPMNSMNFENVKNDQTIIDNNLVEKGIQILNKNIISFEGKEYLYYEVVSNNTNQVFLFTSISNGNTIRFEIPTPNADYNIAMPFVNSIATSAEIYNQ
ncbi:MAG: zinc ribbon domain-containing protein [Bacilli bacterium]|nr:zinc ribbon domain-containing protein [Bacilli bacterium]